MNVAVDVVGIDKMRHTKNTLCFMVPEIFITKILDFYFVVKYFHYYKQNLLSSYSWSNHSSLRVLKFDSLDSLAYGVCHRIFKIIDTLNLGVAAHALF